LFKNLIQQEELIVAPGVYDGLSGLLVARSDFAAAYITGYSVAASRYGLPDAGLIGLAEMLDAIRVIQSVCKKPLIADADTGYGGLLNVQHTVRSYDRLGVDAIQLEDQEMPKKCGHTKGKQVVEATEMIAKIQVALESRSDDRMLVIARTDALATHGFKEAMARCERYAAAGADIVFVDAIETKSQIRQFGRAFRGCCMINVTPPRGGDFKTPQLTSSELREMGFAIAIHPGILGMSAVSAMETALQFLHSNGQANPKVSSQISPHELVGFPQVWADETRWQKQFANLKTKGRL
jgi:2,3-dimethylmalate lyase